MEAASKQERTRLSADDWELGALELIAEQGVSALAVEALARRLGVTKGSFYWHFRTREALLKAALARWERDDDRALVADVDPIPDPRERLRELFRRVAREVQPHRIYAALLKALDHPQVLPLMARVSQRRMDFLALAYRQTGMDRTTALNRARLAYAAYVGFLQLNLTLGLPKLSHEEFDAYVAHVIDTLIPA
ncbi:MAG: helix-turn-helix domain-containing protein [Mizugakiibacter sp.]|uniref:TetR/AcrR family transcriptional regulator n=1 Tax=Mizugakiibacter sp. TaxID=1972610 RepID=UPI0031BDD6BF|nr:TetR/AcrR family transcriptional regulator [Xanthomonadaceae bacterium]